MAKIAVMLTITEVAARIKADTGLEVSYRNLYRRMIRRADCPVRVSYTRSRRLPQDVAAISETDYPVLRDWFKALI